jgi:hypothetical protein
MKSHTDILNSLQGIMTSLQAITLHDVTPEILSNYVMAIYLRGYSDCKEELYKGMYKMLKPSDREEIRDAKSIPNT